MSRSKTRKRKKGKKSITIKKSEMPLAFAELLDDFEKMFGAENVTCLYDEQSEQWKVFYDEANEILK